MLKKIQIKKFTPLLTVNLYIFLNFKEKFFQCVNFGPSTNQVTPLGFLFTFFAINAQTVSPSEAMQD
jgi:hypothetical protein